jgi:hypothetical protein
MNQPLSTPSAMERRFTFAATTVSKSFSPHLLARSTRKNLIAVVGNIQKSKTEET